MADIPKDVDGVIARAKKTFVPEKAKGFKGVMQWSIGGDGGKDYYYEIDNGKLDVVEGTHPNPKLSASYDDVGILIESYDLSRAARLYMSRKIKTEPMDSVLIQKFVYMFEPAGPFLFMPGMSKPREQEKVSADLASGKARLRADMEAERKK